MGRMHHDGIYHREHILSPVVTVGNQTHLYLRRRGIVGDIQTQRQHVNTVNVHIGQYHGGIIVPLESHRRHIQRACVIVPVGIEHVPTRIVGKHAWPDPTVPAPVKVVVIQVLEVFAIGKPVVIHDSVCLHSPVVTRCAPLRIHQHIVRPLRIETGDFQLLLPRRKSVLHHDSRAGNEPSLTILDHQHIAAVHCVPLHGERRGSTVGDMGFTHHDIIYLHRLDVDVEPIVMHVESQRQILAHDTGRNAEKQRAVVMADTLRANRHKSVRVVGICHHAESHRVVEISCTKLHSHILAAQTVHSGTYHIGMTAGT